MKNEKIYALFLRMYNALPENDRNFINRHITENPHGGLEYDDFYSGDFKVVFAECYRVITAECNAERDRKNKTTPLTFIKTVINECKNNKFKPYEKDGKFYVASDPRGFEFSTVPCSIQHGVECSFDLKNLIDDISARSKQALQLPDVNEFIAMCDMVKKSVNSKAYKTWFNSPYCFGADMPSIKISYLYDVLKHLNNPKIYMTWSTNPSLVKLNALYIEFSGGRGVIMPMRTERNERGCAHVN